MNKTIWLWILVVLVIGAVYWISDSRLYDKDIEKDFIRETGKKEFRK